MKMKGKFVAVGLVAGAAIFGNISSAVAQTCYQMPGELKLVTAEDGGEVTSQADMNEIDGDLMESLNENAQKACLGRRFCMENSGMKDEVTTTGRFKVDVSIKRTAIVNCLN